MSARRRIARVGRPDDQGPPGAVAVARGGDELSVEAPLNLVVDDQVIATLMRTPGHDLELAAGWLVVESGVRTATDVVGLRQCRTDDQPGRTPDEPGGRGIDQVHLRLAPAVEPPRPRAWLTGSACGVCSADVLDLAPVRRGPSRPPGWRVSVRVLAGLPDAMRRQQRTFARTGSMHAAALASPVGDLLVAREDVGRHNAVDKVNGWALLNERMPAAGLLLVVSGRVSFEIVQKAVAASVAGIVAVSGPSDLAVDLAREHDLLLVGMVRSGRLNIYAGEDLVAGLD